MTADSSRAHVDTLCVDAAHPSLPGHFPGSPVVPGVVLLSEVLADQRRQLPQLQVMGIKKLKFLRILLPGRRFTVEFATPVSGTLRFKCWQEGLLLAEGNLSLQGADAAPQGVERRA